MGSGSFGETGSQTETEVAVVQIDRSLATPGTAEYEALNNPAPSTIYELSDGTVFETNAEGQVTSVRFLPRLDPQPRDARQGNVGKDGLETDVGGHAQACSLGGTCDEFNLFPQDANFNNSAYKRLENELRRGLQDPDTEVGVVTVSFGRADPSSKRPDTVTVEFSINGQRRVRDFENKSGG